MSVDPTYLAQQTINALQLGSIYALIALGYSMVYGVLVMINFAHGDLFMLGAFACLLLATLLPFQLPFIVILLLVMAVIGLLGALIERVAYRPLRGGPAFLGYHHRPGLRSRHRKHHPQPQSLPAICARAF